MIRKQKWEYSSSKKGLRRFYTHGLLFDTLSISYGIFLLLGIINAKSLNIQLFVGAEGVLCIVLGLVNFHKYTQAFLQSQTVSYEVHENGISIFWGFIDRKVEFISYDNLEEVTQLKDYATGESSILLHTYEETIFKGYDSDNKEFRDIASIEDIEEGDTVYEIIETERKKYSKQNLFGEARSRKVVSEIDIEGKRKEWSMNRNIARLYLFIFMILGLAWIDGHVLEPKTYEDQLISKERLCKTSKGLKFYTPEEEYLPVNSTLILKVSPVYNQVTGVTILGREEKVEVRSGFNGVASVFYIATSIILLITSNFVLMKNGRLSEDQRLMNIFAPAASIVLSLIWYVVYNV